MSTEMIEKPTKAWLLQVTPKGTNQKPEVVGVTFSEEIADDWYLKEAEFVYYGVKEVPIYD